jgi:hypothetical protein
MPRNSQVLWDVLSGHAMCGSPTGSQFTNTVKFFNNSTDKLITAGNYNLHVWTYDGANNKLRSTDATLGTLKRIFKSITVDANDQYAYCGTTTGDLLQVGALRTAPRTRTPAAHAGRPLLVAHARPARADVRAPAGRRVRRLIPQIQLDRVLFKNTGPAKANVQLGVMASAEMPTGDMLIGGGDGSLQVRRAWACRGPRQPAVGHCQLSVAAQQARSWPCWLAGAGLRERAPCKTQPPAHPQA